MVTSVVCTVVVVSGVDASVTEFWDCTAATDSVICSVVLVCSVLLFFDSVVDLMDSVVLVVSFKTSSVVVALELCLFSVTFFGVVVIVSLSEVSEVVIMASVVESSPLS